MPLTHDIGVRIPYPLPRATVTVAFFITDSPEQRDKGRRTPFGQTEQRGPDELRSSRRVVTFEDRRSEINSLSTTENNCNKSLFILHSTAPVQRPGIPIRTGCTTEQCENRLSRRKITAPDKGKNDPCRPPPALPVENSSEPKTARNPNSENHKFKITGLHRQYFSSNRYLCRRIRDNTFFVCPPFRSLSQTTVMHPISNSV